MGDERMKHDRFTGHIEALNIDDVSLVSVSYPILEDYLRVPLIPHKPVCSVA